MIDDITKNSKFRQLVSLLGAIKLEQRGMKRTGSAQSQASSIARRLGYKGTLDQIEVLLRADIEKMIEEKHAAAR